MLQHIFGMKSWRFFSISQSMKEKQRKGKKNKKNKLISDPRYLRVHTDPRFREAPKDETKVTIDSRFKHMFDGNTFFSNSAPIDKRGRPLENKLTLKSDFLRRYYKIINVDEDKVVDEEEGLMEKNDKGAESEETDESKSTTDAEESYTDEDTDTLDIQEEVSMIEEDTYRLAVVNRDWTYVKAVDLYVLFNSFVPPNGMIKSVAIYPTEFGLQRMKEENIHGPVLFDNENEKSDEDNNEKKRAYQKIMMRFYYAVVECDSSATAAHIYEKCNGFEWLSSPLDLRFIPDFWEFKQEPRGDVVTEVPANYDFDPQALQYSKDDVTWDDDDDAVRKRTLGRRFTDEQIAQLECKDYLASDASESGDNSETDDQVDEKARKQDMYLSLVYSGNGSDEDAEHDEVGQEEMEVTFHSGLECLNKKLMEKKDEISETVWEASMRKRREKKKAKKNKLKYSSDDDSDQQAIEEEDGFFIEEPCVKKRKKAQSSKIDEDQNKFQHMDMVVVDKASKEELELLFTDDKGPETRLKGYNLKFKKGKDKIGKENVIIDEGKVPNSTYSDDPRFASFSTPDYAIDPTDPQFKRSAAYARKQLARKQKKGRMELSVPKVMQMSFEDSGNGMMQKDKKEGLLAFRSQFKDKDKFSFLVKSVKMKSKQILDGKTRKDGKPQFEGVEKKKKH